MPSDVEAEAGRKHVGHASFSSSFINLTNTIIGAGVLAMPHAMATLGLFAGTLVLLFAGLTSGFGLYLLTRCAQYVEPGRASFFNVAKKTYPAAAVVFDFAIALKTFGVAVSYLIIISNLTPLIVAAVLPSAGDRLYLIDRRFWLTVFMVIIVPLSFLRKLDSLRYTSVVSLFAIGYLVILVVGHFFLGDTSAQRGSIEIFEWLGWVKFLSSLPVFVFAFTCHQNIFAIVNEIRDASQRNVSAVVATSIGGSTMVYLLVAITGYLSFGDNVNGNIVSMYPNSPTANIGRFAIVVLILFSYPLQAHPCRASIDKIIVSLEQAFGRSEEELSMERDSNGALVPKEMSEKRWVVITTVILVATYLVALTVSSLELVLSYVGATGSTAISFILPGVFYWRIAVENHWDEAAAADASDMDDDSSDDEAQLGRSAVQGRKLGYGRVASAEPAARQASSSRVGGPRRTPPASGVSSLHRRVTASERIASMYMTLRRKRGLITRYAAGALALYGCAFMVICLTLNIVNSVHRSRPPSTTASAAMASAAAYAAGAIH
ncbi:hypothetical protein PYCC9005_001783 [Savitreella phatthalungensis]